MTGRVSYVKYPQSMDKHHDNFIIVVISVKFKLLLY